MARGGRGEDDHGKVGEDIAESAAALGGAVVHDHGGAVGEGGVPAAQADPVPPRDALGVADRVGAGDAFGPVDRNGYFEAARLL